MPLVLARFRPILSAAALGAAAALLQAGPALAQQAGRDAAKADKPAAAADAPLVDGEVRRIDPAKGTILLKHAEIKHLGMSPMTMGFKLRDPALASGLKPGDKVRFAAVQEGETLVVTKIVRP